MSTQDSFIQIERRSSFNPYIWSDPKEELVTFKFQEKYYAALALITQVAFACIIASSLAICAIYAPYLIPGLLFSTYKLYEPIHCYIVIPLQEKGILAKEKMKIANGVVKKLVEIEGYCSSYSSYKNYFTENSLETAFIDHKDKLTSIDPTRICYRALINPLARVSYWSDRSSELRSELNLLQKKKEDKARLYGIEKKRIMRKKLFESISKTDKKMQKLTEQEFLPAKIKAAFNLHLLANPSDRRNFKEFGHLSLMTYQDSLKLRISNEEQPYFYFNQKPELPLTKKWLMKATIPQIAKKIYKDLAITV